MARPPTPFARTAQAHKSKTLLLPMSRRAADEVAMHYHLALDALRMYRGTEHTVRMLAQTLIRASFIADAGYGKLAQEQFQATEAALVLAFDHGSETGDWCLDADAFCLCAALVTLHDQQLRSAPVSVISKANDRLALFGAGERKSRAAGDSKPAAKAGLVRKIERSRPKQHLDALAERDAPRTMVFPRF